MSRAGCPARAWHPFWCIALTLMLTPSPSHQPPPLAPSVGLPARLCGCLLLSLYPTLPLAAIYSSSGASAGVGFAIPVDVVKSSVDQVGRGVVAAWDLVCRQAGGLVGLETGRPAGRWVDLLKHHCLPLTPQHVKTRR